jgi:hypothetical protein
MTVLEREILKLKKAARREWDVRERITLEDEIAFLEDMGSDLEDLMPAAESVLWA